MLDRGSHREGLEFSDRLWRFAGCEVDELKLQLRVRGQLAELELKPFEVLLHLLRHAGEVVSKEDLLESVWPGLMVVDGSLATAVSKLRRALGDQDSSIIVTVPRVGYRLAVPVQVSRQDARENLASPAKDTTQSVIEASPNAEHPAKSDRAQDKETESNEGRPKSRSLSPIAVVLGLVIVLGLGLLVYRRVFPNSVANAPPRITSLAVLPLVNMSGDASQDYLADGMTEELITELAQIRALKVISHTSVVQYKGARRPLPEIAKELRVDGIVEGAVIRSGDHVHVTAQLIHGPTDTNLWADSYDGAFTDILILQERLARQIARRIEISITPSEQKLLASAETVNPEAHELYLKGRYFWNQRTNDGLDKAVEFFHQASQKDPDDALAYAGLADSYVELVSFADMTPAEGVPKARAAALKAISLDDSRPEPHTALGFCAATDWDWPGAEKEFQRALELNPRYSVALYQYGIFLSSLGRADEALTLTQQALDLDPISPVALYRAGRVQYQARHYDKALEEFSRVLELNPANHLGLYGLGLVYKAEGKYDKAILYFEHQSLDERFELFATYAAAGQKDLARRMFAGEMRRRSENHLYIRPGWVAEVYTDLGDKDEAFRWLERAYREHDIWMVLLKVWPNFDPLRSDPRFKDLLRRMKFVPDNT